MKLLIGKITDVEADSLQLISLFMRGFLLKERLVSRKEIERWMKVLERVRASHWGKWADFTRRVLAEVAESSLCSTLERPLTETERTFLTAHVDEFVDSYAKERLGSFFKGFKKGETSCLSKKN